MKTILAFILVLTLLGCGDSETVTKEQLTDASLVTNGGAQETTEETTEETTDSSPDVIITPKEPKKTVTIYVHGFSKTGYKKVGIYGSDNYDEVIDSIVETTGFDTTSTYDENNYTNIIALTKYYGNTPPSYYTGGDIQELNNIGDGIPRYALIIAKYAKYIMQKTGADSVNLMSVSMGSLVTRYLIEKDLEQLSSEKKIDKWLSLEGVIKGNIAASGDTLFNLVEFFDEQSIDVDHMKYSWINDNLNLSNPYYHTIQIGFESSTKDDAHEAALSLWLRLNGSFEANDGVQAVRDTFFETNATNTFYHDNHYTLADNKAAWGYAATFLTSKKHLKITLLDATINDLHEDSIPFLNIKPADIVFQSRIYSQKAEEKWHFTNAIDERVLRGGYLPLHGYQKEGVKQTLNQELFDSFILEEESELTLELTPYELDMEPDYGVREFTGHGDNESIGTISIMIPAAEGIYPLQSEDWSGSVKVDVY